VCRFRMPASRAYPSSSEVSLEIKKGGESSSSERFLRKFCIIKRTQSRKRSKTDARSLQSPLSQFRRPGRDEVEILGIMAEALAVLGLVVGVPGLFQSCVHGYRTLISSVHVGKDSAILFTQLRIQQGRLIDIGRSWGLFVSDDGNVSSVPQGAATSLVDQMRQQSAEAIAPLINDILSQISDLLADSKKLSSRYGLVSGEADGPVCEKHSLVSSTCQCSSHSIDK
jgi:hypothetical protein